MQNLLFTLSLVLCFSSLVSAQRYKEAIFSDVDIQRDIVYGEALGYAFVGSGSDVELRFDFYEPQGDTAQLRPLVLAFFGGAFIAGSKESDDMQAWCDSLARYGYACASVSYRLGYNPISGASVTRAGYRALQDARAAIRFFKEYHLDYSIDTNYIFLLGNSAGAITALQAAYASDANRPQASFGTNDILGNDGLDLGCIDCSGNTYLHSPEVQGVIGMWGAVLDTAAIDSNDSAPALMFHGNADGTVPMGSDNAFSTGIFPVLHGSEVIDRRLRAAGIASTFYEYDGLGHNFYYDGTSFPNAYWDTLYSLSHPWLCDLHPYCIDAQNPPTALAQSELPALRVYPNPGRQQIFIELPNAEAWDYRCINSLGQVLAQGRFEGSREQVIQSSNWPQGMYYIQLSNAQGQRIQEAWIKQ